MATNRKTKKRPLFRLCILAFVCYMVGVLINLQIELTSKKQELDKVNQSIKAQEIANKELEMILSKGDDADYIERIAKEKLDFAYPDEKVYIDISGN